jgi:hypothetical protein
MTNFIELSFPNHVDEDAGFPIEFEVTDYKSTVSLFVTGDERLITLTHAQFEEAIKFYLRNKAEKIKERMRCNNTIVDYSGGGLIQPCKFEFSGCKELD